MPLSTPERRAAWKAYECAPNNLTKLPFGPDQIRIAPPAADAFHALAAVFEKHAYEIRTGDTDSYSCRASTGGGGKSLHSYGIALDVNWNTNPYKDHSGVRAARFSAKPTQAGRAADVQSGAADTDMTPAMIADVRAIHTAGGKQVFGWGGDWRSVKDCMHFELLIGPDDLAGGLNTGAADGGGAGPATPAATDRLMQVIARHGLNLRNGPAVTFASTRIVPFGTKVHVTKIEGDWAFVDLEGDGHVDGCLHAAFLRAG